MMGVHFANPPLTHDAEVHPRHPEMLLYMPTGDRRPRHKRLVGVEYFVPAADQDPPIDDSDRPYLFGRPFDGPMAGHSPGMPYHYDLHVWLWAYNPSGLFSMWNANLSCPR